MSCATFLSTSTDKREEITSLFCFALIYLSPILLYKNIATQVYLLNLDCGL